MYEIKKRYGYRAFRAWHATKPRDLTEYQSDTPEADSDIWVAHSYSELLDAISFLTAMNKRHTLFFRGQTRNVDPKPALFRTQWSFMGFETFAISNANRQGYWEFLPTIGRRVFEICDREDFGLPRWRGLRDVREIQWAVIQHYQLWPTPLIDISSSIRASASFAMGCSRGSAEAPRSGYLYVIGLPYSTGSITYDIDENLLLARLVSACPPVAKRPHYQDGFLVGRFPFAAPNAETERKSSLTLRLIAKFELRDAGRFWDADFPLMSESALMPKPDKLYDAFLESFARQQGSSVLQQAREIASQT